MSVFCLPFLLEKKEQKSLKKEPPLINQSINPTIITRTIYASRNLWFFFWMFKKSKNNNPAHVTACSVLKEGDKGGDMS